MLEIAGRLEDKQGGLVRSEGCRVEAAFIQRIPIDGSTAIPPDRRDAVERRPPARRRAPASPPADLDGDVAEFAETPQRVVARTDAMGRFVAMFPDKETIISEAIVFAVSSPSGLTIGRTQVRTEKLATDLRLVVEAEAPIDVDPETTVLPAATSRKVRGRVIDLAGRANVNNLNVVVYGGAGEQGAAAPLFVAATDRNGYFVGEYALVELTRGYAVIGGYPAQVEIVLSDDQIPDPLLLVVEFPVETGVAAAPEDCECKDGNVPRAPTQIDIATSPDSYSTDLGTGRCVQFNVPNRAIEEFDFYTVVRTTEPEIRGATFGAVTVDSRKIDTLRKYVEKLRRLLSRRGRDPVWTLRLPDATPGEFLRQLQGAGTDVDQVLAAVRRAVRGDFGEILETDIAYLSRWIAAFETDRSNASPGRAGRATLDAANPIDWDATPTFYEAATIAHGHILHFKQVWYADGYSLGDLLYSLPLAPGQKKLIAVVDWERREASSRTEDTLFSEALYASLSRDRDLTEVVSGTLRESMRGGSRASTAGFGLGSGGAASGVYKGVNFGGLVGLSGGLGTGDSRAWQRASRSFSSQSLQKLRDDTLQSASSVRGLRSTVVHSATQGEAVQTSTEVIANHNHCHAITVQYFEVLRHLKITHELADVQECLFIPLPMSEFDRPKALRWRQPLQQYLQSADLAPAFDATQRVETGWSEVDYPAQTYGDELVTTIRGELRLTLVTPLPPFDVASEIKSDPAKVALALSDGIGFLGGLLAIATGGLSLVPGTTTAVAAHTAAVLAAELAKEPTAAERYSKFQREVMPGVAAGFANSLELYARVGNTESLLSNIDFTLVGEYRPGAPLLVAFRGAITGSIKRSDISSLVIKAGFGLPTGCRAIINSAVLRYRTRLFEHGLAAEYRLNDDLDLPTISIRFIPPASVEITKTAPGSGAFIETPLDEWELRNPRKEDIRLSSSLLHHLNANLEYYHQAIWWTMDANRRYMLLDGFVAPSAGERSVASVVENRIIGMAGNSLIMPVAPGNHLDPRFNSASEEPVDLLGIYAPASPVPPARVSLPTRGVFAEAVMGSCNACEQIDESRLWRWDESPIDEPPALDSAMLGSRRADTSGLTPTTFPNPLVAIQNAPAVPDPAGPRVAADVVTRQSFPDITGLAGNQANAAAAYQQALSTALAFGKEASTLAQQAAMLKSLDRAMMAIDRTEATGKIDAGSAQDLRMSALKKAVGDGGASAVDGTEVQKRLSIIADAVNAGAISKDDGQTLSRDVLRNFTNAAEGAAGSGALSDLARGFDAGRIERLKVGAADGSYGEVIQAVSRPDELGQAGPTPAHKTGMSQLSNERGQTSSFVRGVLDDSKNWTDSVGKALADWKNKPNKELSDAITEAFKETALKAADKATDDIPIVNVIKLAAKYSIVFAEGIGEGLQRANDALSARYDAAIQKDPGSDGYTPEDIAALQYLRSYQLNAVNALPDILLAGVDNVVKYGLGKFADWVSGKVTASFLSMSKSLLEHLIAKSPLKALISGALEAGGENIAANRQEIYRAALSSTISLFIKQLENQKTRDSLNAFTSLGGKEPLDKALLKALSSAFVDTAVQDPRIKQVMTDINKGTRTWVYGQMKQIADRLRDNGVVIAPTNGQPSVNGDTVYVPAKVLTAIDLGEAAAAEEDLQLWFEIETLLEPICRETGYRLTLLSKVRQRRLVYLDEQGEPEKYDEELNKYWRECRDACVQVSNMYRDATAGGASTLPSLLFVSFESVDPQRPRRRERSQWNVAGRYFHTTEPLPEVIEL